MTAQAVVSENKALSRRFFEEVLNKRDLDKLDELFAETYTHHDAVTGKELHGLREFRKTLEQFTTAFPDTKMTVVGQVADEGHVATRLTMEGTHDGPLRDIDATGKRIEIEGIVEHRIKNGKIVEGFPQWDMLGMMRQIGVVPDEPAR